MTNGGYWLGVGLSENMAQIASINESLIEKEQTLNQLIDECVGKIKTILLTDGISNSFKISIIRVELDEVQRQKNRIIIPSIDLYTS